MIHAGKLSLAATGIVLGGVTLGAALAAYANPLPKPAAPSSWESALRPAIYADAGYGYLEAPPEEVNVRDGFAPGWAMTELPDSAMRFPRWAEYRPEPLDTPRFAELDTAAYDTPEPSVPHFAAWERADAAPAPAPASGAEGAPIDAGADPAAFTVPVDPATPPPLPSSGAKTIHVGTALAD